MTWCYLGGGEEGERGGWGLGEERVRNHIIIMRLCSMVDRKRVSVFRVDLGIPKSGHPWSMLQSNGTYAGDTGP